MKKISGILIFLLLSLDVLAVNKFISSISLKTPGNSSESYDLKMYDGNFSCDKSLPVKLTYTIDDGKNGVKVLNVHIAAVSDAWFSFQGVCQTSIKHADADFYLPGFWYHKNLRSPKESPSFHTGDSWRFREDRLSTPLTCVMDASTGRYCSVMRIADYKEDALTTHSSGEVMLSGKSDVGYLGFENRKGLSALCFGYPFQEVPYTYIRKRTLAPATHAFAFLPKGECIDLKWQVKEGKTESFASLVAQMWEYSYDTYRPQEVSTPYNDDFFKKTLSNYFRESYVERSFVRYTSGEGLLCADCEPKSGAQVGFVGRVLLNAFNSIEYGTSHHDTGLVSKGQSVFSDYLVRGLAENGLIKEHINTSTGKTEQACSIRRQSEGIYAVLLYLDFEKSQGRLHPEWESAIRTLLDLFLSIQNADGSFPRRFNYDLSLIDETGGSTGSATLPLIMGYKYFRDIKYLDAAKKTVEYLEKEIISKSDYFSSTLDARCEDKEAAIAAATATYYMALVSRGSCREHYARLCKQASYFALSWYYTWDVPFSQGQMLGDLGFKTRGWGNVSAENNHVDVFVFEFGNVLKWLSGYFSEPRFERFLGVMASSMKQLLPVEGRMNGIAKVGFYPEVVQHTNWDYGKNGKGYYNDIFAPGWTVASLWELYTPGRTEQFLGVKPCFDSFPDSADPLKVGRKLACHFVATPHRLNSRGWMDYPENCTINGVLMFAGETGETALVDSMASRIEPLCGIWRNCLPGKGHVDHNMFGATPLNLYLLKGDEKYLKMGIDYADAQWKVPEKATEKEREWAGKGFTWQTRLWIDDMYMITIVQSRAFLATGDTKYLDRAAQEMCMYLDTLQMPNGLFHHAPDVPYYWCRGNGWMATGMTEILKLLPGDHPCRERIMEGYLLMMDSLLKCRNAEGLWNQLIDEPDFWTETSGSAMFTYAFVTGVKRGWLDESSYGQAARTAWTALVSYLNENGDIRNVCAGTNKKNDKQYYYDRPRNTGDFHGQAPMLWCASAFLE